MVNYLEEFTACRVATKKKNQNN